MRRIQKKNVLNQDNKLKKNVCLKILIGFFVVIVVVTIWILWCLMHDSDKLLGTKSCTWEQYVELSVEEQVRFRNAFASEDDFYEWLYSQSEGETLYPWELDGVEPSEYTWKEYEKLVEKDKEAFQACFSSREAFELWQENSKKTGNPWENEGKEPSEYTWEEFEELTSQQQEVFFASFETSDELEQWLHKVDAP